MRKHLQFLLAACLLASGAYSVHAQNRADRQNLENEDSFSMIILGDPQGYTKYDINQPIFELCTAWIADNVEHLNIKAVLCTGDMVRAKREHHDEPQDAEPDKPGDVGIRFTFDGEA